MTAFNEDAYDVAWRWFELHARQRMELFRFYATVYIGLLAGLGALWQFEMRAQSIVLNVLGLLFCLVFQGLDRRTAALIEIGESAMAREQERLKVDVGYDDIEFCRAADRKPRKGRSYGKSVGLMNIMMFIVFLVAIVWIAADWLGLPLQLPASLRFD